MLDRARSRALAFQLATCFALAAATASCGGCKKHGDSVWTAACSGLDDFVLSGWARSPTDIWFVGGNAAAERGLLLHYDGTSWLSTTGVADRTLWWVSGSSGEVWAVGADARAYHLSGGVWSRTCTVPSGCNTAIGTCANDTTVACTMDSDCPYVPLPTLFGVWGSAPDAVWAVGGDTNPAGPQDVFLFWNGEQWIPGSVDVPSGRTIFKVWGSAADDVWAVGGGGVIFHFTGSIWQATPSPTEEDLISVWGNASDDVWAIGGISTGTLLHYDGTAWSVFDQGFSPGGMISVWTSPTTSPVVTGYFGWAGFIRNGDIDPSVTGIEQALHSVFGDGQGTWAVGGNLADPGAGPGGVIMHFGLEPAACTIEEFNQPVVPTDCGGAGTCPGGGGTVGPGEACASGRDCECMAGLSCWYIVIPDSQIDNHFICTEDCGGDLDCDAVYGAGSCCIIPGPQTVETVCHPPNYTPVSGDPCM